MGHQRNNVLPGFGLTMGYTLAYLSLDGLLHSVTPERTHYCTSCYTGVYPVAFPRDEAAYLQLALKLNPEPAAPDPEPDRIAIPTLDSTRDVLESPRAYLEKDPVVS